MPDPTPRYRGKRINLTVPLELYEKIEVLAKSETRPVSQMFLRLVQEGYEAREDKK
jgi:hypothetical protein